MRVYWSLPALAVALSACSVNPPVTPSLANQCQAPRPQVCTMEYAPVCADLLAGGKKEYSSACNACADEAVAAYLRGPCPEGGK